MQTILWISTIALYLLMLSGCTSREVASSEQRIVFFGDSITQMGTEPGGYVSLIADSLAGRESDDVRIIGAGISGNKVTDLLERIDGDVLAHDPTTVVVYIGINDVWHWTSGNGTTREEFEGSLIRLTEQLQNSGARVILCTPSVIGEKYDGSNGQDEMLDEYAETSRQVARQFSIETCDLRNDFLAYLRTHNPENAEEGILTTDGVHLNERGNRFVADRILATLDRLNPEQ